MATTPTTTHGDQIGTSPPPIPQRIADQNTSEIAAVRAPDAKGRPAPKTLLHWEDKSRRRRGRVRIGVEFDGRRMVLIAVRHTGKRNTVERFGIVEWPEAPSVDDLTICLRKFAPRGRPSTAVVISTPRAMVRYFHLPPVTGRHRDAAARWQGQKLLPFPLEEETALVGLDFERDGKDGWWTTLVAIPREDGAPILEAIDRLEWPLRSVSLRGTQFVSETTAVNTNAPPETRAVVLYSDGRGCFTVFREGRLRFHYDLGMIPEPPTVGDAADSPWAATPYRAWVEILRSLIADPFEFCLGVGPDDAPRRLELIGFPEAILPLVTDWNSRFPSGVTVIDPLRETSKRLPSEIAQWVNTHTGLLAPSFLAASGSRVVDCTPSAARRKRRLDDYSRIARGVFLISVVIASAWSVFNWVSLDYGRRTLASAWEEHRMFHESPAVADVRAKIEALTHARDRLAQIQLPSVRWMPWIKAVLATLPDNASLTLLEAQRRPSPTGAEENALTVRLIGVLSPDGPPHALNYRRWMGQLAKLTDPTDRPRLQERPITWKGKTRSTFSIELSPAISTLTGVRR